MLKISAVIVIMAIFYLVINALTSDGVKSFYCLSDDKCVTVWKRKNGEVYIIPGRFENNSSPTVSHTKTTNKQFFTLYFSNEKGFSNKIIVRDEGNLESSKKLYTIENGVKGEWVFLEFSDSVKSILYYPDAIKFNDVKTSAEYLTINIQENYAIDKIGKKLE